MISLTLKNLTKKFGKVTAVDEVSLDVPPGKLIALLGPSGCGKTTTLNMIAGLLEPTAGDVLFDGKSVVHIPAEKRRIGMVFQRYILFPHMNVFENIAFGLRMQKLPKDEIIQRVNDILELVQLTELAKRHPSQLSGGQMQRVAIARAVVIEPNLLLMDEPLANLDAKLRLEMREFIRDLQKELGITTLFVTHDQAEAAVLADMVAVMFDGCFHQFSTPLELFNCPASPKVSVFMGSTNVLEGEITEKTNEGHIISSCIGEITSHMDNGKEYKKGDQIKFMIRPDHIDLREEHKTEKGLNEFWVKKEDMIYEGELVKYLVTGANDASFQIHTRSTQLLAEWEHLDIYLAPNRVWIIPNPEIC